MLKFAHLPRMNTRLIPGVTSGVRTLTSGIRTLTSGCSWPETSIMCEVCGFLLKQNGVPLLASIALIEIMFPCMNF